MSLIKSRIRNYIYFMGKRRIFEGDTSENRIVYFGIPMHPNLGDQAQKMCIRKWLNDNYAQYQVLEIPTRIIVDNKFKFLPILRKNIRKNDIFIFQSGYCTHDIEPSKEDLMHRIIIENFPNNRMLMLPQTIFFENIERKELSRKIYNLAENMVFLARDKVSWEFAKDMFSGINILLYPDIVTTLIGRYSYNHNRKGIKLCIRQDCEKFYSDLDINILAEKLSGKWVISRGDTTIQCDPYWLDKHVEEKIHEVLQEYSSYRLIITDRYHGTIFSLIANTPVIVLKTQDHKVVTGIDWFKDVYKDKVYFANDLEEAYELSESILNRNDTTVLSPYFQEKYYDNLKQRFVEMTYGDEM